MGLFIKSPTCTDYLSLLKFENGWKIIAVVAHERE